MCNHIFERTTINKFKKYLPWLIAGGAIAIASISGSAHKSKRVRVWNSGEGPKNNSFIFPERIKHA